MKIKMDEDLFGKNAQSFSKLHHEVLLLYKFLQTKAQIRNMNVKYYDLHYTVDKNRDDKESVNDKYKNGYINFYDIVSNHYMGRKNSNEILM